MLLLLLCGRGAVLVAIWARSSTHLRVGIWVAVGGHGLSARADYVPMDRMWLCDCWGGERHDGCACDVVAVICMIVREAVSGKPVESAAFAHFAHLALARSVVRENVTCNRELKAWAAPFP